MSRELGRFHENNSSFSLKKKNNGAVKTQNFHQLAKTLNKIYNV